MVMAIFFSIVEQILSDSHADERLHLRSVDVSCEVDHMAVSNHQYFSAIVGNRKHFVVLILDISKMGGVEVFHVICGRH